ncbi:MAG: DUF86 domain-containing protein, partial [Planctomycetota bacterium]
ALLLDSLRATELLQQGTSDFDLTRFRGDVWVQSAAERRLIVIGEAVRRMRELDAHMVARLSDARSIVGFRNVLIHNYEQVDVEIVWQAIQTRIPQLRSEVERLLSGSLPAGPSSGY